MDSIRIARVDNVTLETFAPPNDAGGVPNKERRKGTLHLTPHHLIFTSTSGFDPTSCEAETWIPYPSITLLTRLPQTFGGVYPLQIRTRTFHSYVLGFDKAMEGGAEDVWLSVKDCAVAASVEQLYAFNYKLPQPAVQTPYNPRTEFARQGVGSRSNAWRFTDINKDYAFCPTYPARMVVPKAINDSVLTYAGKYRSKGRIPALTYLHWANQASITRSSQPMVGLKNARSQQDERLIECIFTSHQYNEPQSSFTEHIYGATATNLIIDARPTTNAMANVAMGAGTENMDNYRLAKKAYLGIDNIHVMRNSLKMIAETIAEAEQTGVMDRNKLRRSNWLKHISTVLEGSLGIIKNIHLNASHVLIHCSDGWDRTAQLSAVAQICLDPFYRTFEGFKVLIEKDWVSFGHKFLDRSGHLSNEKLFTVDQPDDDSDEEGVGAQKAAQAFFASVQKQFNKSDHRLKEVSPVFAQFLECVWQIQRQFPDRFEWNEQYLLDLHYHLYACQFGTFVFNCEKQRRVPDFDSGRDAIPYIDQTVSAWEWFDLPEQREKYRNPTYDAKLDDKKSDDQGVLLYNPRDVRFWHRLFRRGDEEMNGRLQPIQNPDFVTVAPGQADPVTSAIQAPFAESASDPLSRSMSPSDGSSAPIAGPSKGWGWSQLSNGAISALQRGAKGVKTIGEGAYSHIRAELDAAEQGQEWGRPRQVSEREMSSDPWRSKTTEQGVAPTYKAGQGQDPYAQTQKSRRLDLDDPWSRPDPPAKSVTSASSTLSASAAPALAPPIAESSRSSSRQSGAPHSEDDIRHSLHDLTLLGQPKPLPARPVAAVASKPVQYQDRDKEVMDALGGDQKAWDPLGAM